MAARSTCAHLQPQLAGDDARDVEEVFDQSRLRARVALDALEAAFPRRLIGAGRAQHPRPAEHRVQRRPQLVRQRGQEFVLQPIGFALALQRGDAVERLCRHRLRRIAVLEVHRHGRCRIRVVLDEPESFSSAASSHGDERALALLRRSYSSVSIGSDDLVEVLPAEAAGEIASLLVESARRPSRYARVERLRGEVALGADAARAAGVKPFERVQEIRVRERLVRACRAGSDCAASSRSCREPNCVCV